METNKNLLLEFEWNVDWFAQFGQFLFYRFLIMFALINSRFRLGFITISKQFLKYLDDLVVLTFITIYLSFQFFL